VKILHPLAQSHYVLTHVTTRTAKQGRDISLLSTQ